MAANCNDRANVLAAQARYAYHPAGLPPLTPCAAHATHIRCQDPSQLNHRNVMGGVAPPRFTVCRTCMTRGNQLTGRLRRLVAAPPGTPFTIRPRGQLLTGVDGAHRRGWLCGPCVDMEIEAYYRRRFIDGQSVVKASRTCKCEKDYRKRLCVEDRIKVLTRIQAATDRNAGPNGWLEHLDFAGPPLNRATYANTPVLAAALLTRRRGVMPPILDNACRCGADVPHPGVAQLTAVPTPVAACTACSGVLVDPHHPQVINFVNVWNYNPHHYQPNMDYGRHIP